MQKQQQQQPGRKSLIPSSTLTPSVTHHRILSSVCPQSARLPSRLRPSGWAITAGLPFPTPSAHSCLMISLVIQRSQPPARPPANSICPHSDGGPGSRRCARRVTRTAFGAYPNPPRLETGSVRDCATKPRLSAKAAMTSLLQTASSIEHCWRSTLICIVLPFNSHGFKSRQTPHGWQAP